MKLDGLGRRVGILEARQPRGKSDSEKFLEKCTDEELDLMIDVLTAQEEGRDLEFTPEQEKLFTAHMERMRNEGFIIQEDFKT